MHAATTQGRWRIALGPDPSAARAAREELGAVHWYPIYAFLRAAGFDADTAAARTESALTRFIEEQPPPAAQAPVLREYLRALACEALVDAELREPILRIPRPWAASRSAQETARTPDEAFTRRWSLGMIESAVLAIEKEYRESGRGEFFDAAQPMLGFTAHIEGDEPYTRLAAQLNISTGAVRKGVFEMRTRYRELLLREVADTVASDDQVQAEMGTLVCELPPPAATIPPRSILARVNPEDLLARGMRSVKISTAGYQRWIPPTVPEAARLFPGYEVVDTLGHGGMGAVYKARQTTLDRLVAIKLLPLEVSADQSFADRFRREARAMGKLSHPNIISLFDFGQTAEGHLFFAMEFVDGSMLHDLIQQEALGLAPLDAFTIAEQVCDALAYAHSKGVVHRDIKPANVMVDRQLRVKVADFGLARLMGPGGTDEWGSTMTGTIMGTPDYMAPEQKRGMQVDHRADIYSLGVVLYEMLCKETPQGAFELPSVRRGLDPRVDMIITKAMAAQPERRYQSTLELKQALQNLRPSIARTPRRVVIAKPPAQQPRVQALPPAYNPPAAARARKKRSPYLTGSIASVAFAAIAIGLIAASKSRQRPTAAQPTPAPTPVSVATARPPARPANTPPPKENRPPAAPKATVANNPPDSAPQGIPETAVTFQGHRYQFVPGRFSWEDARSSAESMGGHLATITTAGEHDWATRTFLRKGARLWLGAERTQSGEWKWVTGEAWDFTAWAEHTNGTHQPAFNSADGKPATALELALDDSIKPPGGWCARSRDTMAEDASTVGFLVEWESTDAVASSPMPAPKDPPASPTPAPAAAPEVVQWIAEKEATFTVQWKKEAIEPFESEIAQLRANYLATVEKTLAAASQAGRLDEAVAWRDEKARLEAGQQPHDASDSPQEPAALRQHRDQWRKAYARADAERFARAKAVHGRFDSLLEKAQLGYTRRQRFEDALLAKTKREQITKEWLVPPIDFSKAPETAQTATAENGETLVGREAILHLRGIGFNVSYRDASGDTAQFNQQSKPEDLPTRGRLEIVSLTTSGLRRIADEKTPVTDADLARLAPMRELTRFELRAGKEVTGAGLGFLSGSPDLEHVHLSSPALGDDALDALLGHRKIKQLTIEGGERALSGARLADAPFIQTLETLLIGRGFQSGDPFLAAGVRMRKLRQIELTAAREFSPDDISPFLALPNLERARFIGLNAKAVTALAPLERAPKLTFLELSDCDGSNGLSFIPKMRKLRHLVIDAEDASNLPSNASGGAMQVLEFSGQGSPPADSALVAATKAFPRLEQLHLGWGPAHNITVPGIRALAALPRLQTLTWSKKPLTRELLAEIAALPHLTTLDLSGTNLTDDDLAPLAASRSITSVSLQGNNGITRRCVDLLKGMPKLRTLRVQNTRVSADEIAGMQRMLPRVSINPG